MKFRGHPNHLVLLLIFILGASCEKDVKESRTLAILGKWKHQSFDYSVVSSIDDSVYEMTTSTFQVMDGEVIYNADHSYEGHLSGTQVVFSVTENDTILDTNLIQDAEFRGTWQINNNGDLERTYEINGWSVTYTCLISRLNVSALVLDAHEVAHYTNFHGHQIRTTRHQIEAYSRE